ncbi:MAG TPA: wax ester/triacylglycerol synthase family O-acyltransferase [Thermoanaerobaculia bacterium]|nr:wax ester/triacylglycerol synthase family O-acyltransferase [Thermoanaerobaculia bacterium]
MSATEKSGAPDAPVPLAPVDHAWLRMDDPTNLMIINGVLALGAPVARERIRRLLEARLLPIPRFRQRVVLNEGAPYWQAVAGVDLDQHLVEVTLPAPGGDVELAALVSAQMSEPLDLARPLWRFFLVQSYNGGSAIFGRLHHCIGDGLALLLVLLSLTDVEAGAPVGPDESEVDGLGNPFLGLLLDPPRGIAAERELIGRIMPEGLRLLEASAAAFKSMGALATGVASTGAFSRLILRPSDPKTIFKGPLGVPKKVAWSDKIAVEEVREIGKALGGTLNDVLLSAMTGGLRRYLDAKGEPGEGINFRAAMPVNLRPLARMAELGNEFGLVFLSLPVGAGNALERLRELRRRSAALKRSAEPLVVYGILKLLGIVPPAVQRMVVSIFATKATAVMTNVPGPRETLYLAGKPIDEIFFWVPQSGRVGLGISIFSYAGHVRVGVGTDAGLVPDPGAVVAGFHEEYAELRRLAGR